MATGENLSLLLRLPLSRATAEVVGLATLALREIRRLCSLEPKAESEVVRRMRLVVAGDEMQGQMESLRH